MKFISQGFPGFACDSIERLYREYLRMENKWQSEERAHEATKKELKELKASLKDSVDKATAKL
jgi:hypothetical protein